jgi:hypothetical protein
MFKKIENLFIFIYYELVGPTSAHNRSSNPVRIKRQLKKMKTIILESENKREKMRLPGVEPGSIAWKAIILTVGLQTQYILYLEISIMSYVNFVSQIPNLNIR